MFETKVVGPCLVGKLKWGWVGGGGHGLLGPSSGYALVKGGQFVIFNQ